MLVIWPDCTAHAHMQIVPLRASLSQVGAVQEEMAILERDSETVHQSRIEEDHSGTVLAAPVVQS